MPTQKAMFCARVFPSEYEDGSWDLNFGLRGVNGIFNYRMYDAGQYSLQEWESTPSNKSPIWNNGLGILRISPDGKMAEFGTPAEVSSGGGKALIAIPVDALRGPLDGAIREAVRCGYEFRKG